MTLQSLRPHIVGTWTPGPSPITGSHTDWKDLLVGIKDLNELVIYLNTCCNVEDSSEFMKGLSSAIVKGGDKMDSEVTVTCSSEWGREMSQRPHSYLVLKS